MKGLKRLTLLLFIIFVFSSFLFLLSFTVLSKTNSDESKTIETRTYKYVTINSLTKTTKRGFISLPTNIEDSITFETSVGVKTLISNIWSDEYYCSGSCYCDENNVGRRNSGSSVIMKRGLLFLTSALSSIIAFKKAEDYFSQECQLGLESECPLVSIHSEVDECDPIDVDSIGTSLDQVDSEISSREDDGSTTEYLCSGRCVPDFNEVDDKIGDGSMFEDSFGDDIEAMDAFKAIALDRTRRIQFCNSILLEENVFVERQGIRFEQQEEVAINNFKTLHLHKFCKGKSVLTPEERREAFGWEESEVTVRLWNIRNQAMKQKFSEGERSVCKATGVVFVPGLEFDDDSLAAKTIVCLRQFTSEEWEKKIPYEKENLRHWKEGYKTEPDYFSHEQLVRIGEKRLQRFVLSHIKDVLYT